jgi:hypothetical protein
MEMRRNKCRIVADYVCESGKFEMHMDKEKGNGTQIARRR